VIGQFRDGATVKPTAVTAILETIDRIKDILAELAEKARTRGQRRDADRRASGPGRSRQGELKQQPPADISLDPVAAYLARHGQTAPETSVEDIVFRSAPGPQRGRNGRIEGAEAPHRSRIRTALHAAALRPHCASMSIRSSI
jgi:two-component system chemotaxis sensor kinase CheA